MQVRTLLVMTFVLTICLMAIAGQSKRMALTAGVVDLGSVHDSFTAPNGTTLENHPLDTGQAWLHVPYAASGSISIDGNWAHHGSVGFRTIYTANIQLPANQYVQGRVKFRDGTNPYFLLRAKSPTETYVAVYYDWGARQWVMIADVDYTGPQSVYELARWSDPVSIGDVRDIRFTAVDDELRFYTSVNGNWVERMFAETYYVLDGGMAGIGLHGQSGPSGTYIDDFDAGSVNSVPTPTPTPSPTPSPSPSSSPVTITCTIVNKVLTCPLP